MEHSTEYLYGLKERLPEPGSGKTRNGTERTERRNRPYSHKGITVNNAGNYSGLTSGVKMERCE